MIELKNISKSFGVGHSLVRVLDNIHLRIEPETLNIFLGRSGSGKSTLLNLIAGIDRPDTGAITVMDRLITGENSEQLADFRLNHVGLIFQFFNLLPTLSLKENVALAGHLKSLPEKEIEKRVQKALQQVNLTEEAGRMPHEASGGEIQRAAIARALINEPDIILADEPTGNLDEKNRELVAEIFRALVRDQKKTVLMVTHDSSFSSLGDRVFRLENGRLV